MRAMRRIVRLLLVAGVLAGSVVVPRNAGAAASARLVYMRGPGAEQCPGEDALRAAVGTRLGYDPFFAWAHDTMFIEIARTGSSFVARIALVDEQNMQRGEREISVEGTDCSPVIDAVGLTASLTIDPSSVTGARPPAPPPAPDAAPPADASVPSMGASEPVDVPAPRKDARAPESPDVTPVRGVPGEVSGHVGLAALGSLGSAPGASAGAALFGGVAWRSLFLDVEGRADAPSTGSSGLASPSRVTSWLVAGSLVPCARLRFAFGCAVFSAGAVGATSNAPLPRSAYAPWAAAGARAGVELALSERVSWRGYGELLVTTTANTLEVDGARVFAFGALSGSVGLGLALRFP